jgi:NAD(P)-dependent dehydrogenase (short-subunit alcohol dehydrogenase family)
VITLSELLAEEYKEQGIAFNVLALGSVQTEMLEEAFGLPSTYFEEWRNIFLISPNRQYLFQRKSVASILYKSLTQSIDRYLAKFLPDHAVKPAFELIVTHGI